ncbi:MAG: cation diffusion facilitator family transporter [Candidatus Ornithospirochaeta sp.]
MVEQDEARSSKIKRAANTGIGVNVALGAVKIVVGYISGSVAIVSDGANNATDSISSLVTLLGYRFSKKRPTKEHPLGYGRIEYLSALLVGILILMTGISFFNSSIDAIKNPHDMSVSAVMIVALFATVLVKIWLWRMNTKVGKETGSEALEASGADALSDVLTSMVTIVAAFVSKFSTFPIDGWAGLLISLFIMWNGISAILSTSNSILGERPDKEKVNRIRAIISSYPPLSGGYDMRIHSYGPDSAVGTIDVEVPFTASAESVYEAMMKAREAIRDEMGIDFTFGMNATNQDDPSVIKMRDTTLSKMQMISSDVIGIHGFHVHFDEKKIEFDVVVDFSLKDHEKFRKRMKEELMKTFPGYNVEFNIDLDYS